MDDILEKFENTLTTPRTEDDLSHKDLYKNWGKYGNQEERRAEILQQQKSNRENKLDNFRGILNLITCTEDKSSVFRKKSQARYQPTVYVPGFTNSSNFYYNNVLMLSEWMVERPEDLTTNWLMTPCPKATRTLVVASNGVTRCYSKYGQLVLTIPTLLPGGNSSGKWKNGSVLDCFYHRETNTMYVLDILSWNNHVMADGEMEFRHYWLETKLREQPELEKITKRNRVSFQLLPITPCDPDSLQEFMMTYPTFESTNVDGLLFYHRHGHYVAGETPLVGWLYPYMVPEVLCPGMPIHESYAAGKPEDYVNQATFIQKFEEKLSKKRIPFNKGKKKKTSTSETSMEAEDGTVEQDDSVENNITEQTLNGDSMGQGIDIDLGQQEHIDPGQQGDIVPSQKGNAAPDQNGDTDPGQKGDIAGPDGDSASMEAETTENGGNQACAQVLGSSIFSHENITQRQAKVTKYYSYFN